MNLKNPEVSIIIPVHNRFEELKRALTSVYNQTFKDFEVIIVDDFSSIEINLSKLNIPVNVNVKLIRLTEKGNANIARNKGIECSYGNYISFLDSDDQWKENHLFESLNFLKQNKLDGCFGGIIIQTGEHRKTSIPRNINENEKFINYILDGGLCSTPTITVKANCARDIKFDDKLHRHQDWDFGIRFHEVFNFKSYQKATVIVNWSINNSRKVNIESSIIFINKHGHKLSKINYYKYHRNLYHVAKKLNSEKKIINYYKKNALKYFNVLSITDFMSIFEPKSTIKKVYYYLIYYSKKLKSY